MKATVFFKTATHAIDLGPSGLSGIGPLTGRNFEGRGVRVAVLGKKGKGSPELYGSDVVGFEDLVVQEVDAETCQDSVRLHLLSCLGHNPTLFFNLIAMARFRLTRPCLIRLLGPSPVMVAGMTPLTVKARLSEGC